MIEEGQRYNVNDGWGDVAEVISIRGGHVRGKIGNGMTLAPFSMDLPRVLDQVASGHWTLRKEDTA